MGGEKLPQEVKPLESRFVFRRKKLSNGSVGRFEARLVVNGFMQSNVDHTYSPVVDFLTARLALAFAIQKGLLFIGLISELSFCIIISIRTCICYLRMVLGSSSGRKRP